MKTKREEEFYELAGREMAEKRLVPAVWSKAFSEAMGDQQAALALYIRFRVEQLERDYQQEQALLAKAEDERWGGIFVRLLLFIFIVLMVIAVITGNR